MGRLITTLCLLLMCFTTMKAQDEKYTPNCPIHIIIALDFSASELGFVHKLQQALTGISKKFELHPTILKIGIITFNRGADIVLPLTGESDKLDEAINALSNPYMVFATDIHAAFESAYFDFKNNSVPGIPKYLVLVSDGDPHAHLRGRGFQQDLINADYLKKGNLEDNMEPIHIISLYSGQETEDENDFDEQIRMESMNHMRRLASDASSYYNFNELPSLVNFFVKISSCM